MIFFCSYCYMWGKKNATIIYYYYYCDVFPLVNSSTHSC